MRQEIDRRIAEKEEEFENSRCGDHYFSNIRKLVIFGTINKKTLDVI